jgi:hypothetical protein
MSVVVHLSFMVWVNMVVAAMLAGMIVRVLFGAATVEMRMGMVVMVLMRVCMRVLVSMIYSTV